MGGDFFYVFLYLNGTRASRGAAFAIYNTQGQDFIAITSTLVGATVDGSEVAQAVGSFDELSKLSEQSPPAGQ
jgi:hypothetical protein